MMDMSGGVPPLDSLLTTGLSPGVSATPPTPPGKEPADGGEVLRDDHDDAQQQALLNRLVQTIQHFRGGIPRLFAGVEDPRTRGKCDYPTASLLMTGLPMFVCHLGAQRQIALQLRTPRGAQKMKTLFGVAAVPHGGTLNDAFEQLDPDQMQAVVCPMVARLIRNKILDRSRFLGRFVTTNEIPSSADATGARTR